MNAHVRIDTQTMPARALSELENPLARIIDLAEAASAVTARDLGTQEPAGTLDTLLQLIVEEAQKAEGIRLHGWRGD